MAAQERRPFFCPDVVASKLGSLPLAVSLPGLIEPHSSTQGAVMVVRCLDHLVVCVVGFHTALTYIAPLGLVSGSPVRPESSAAFSASVRVL
jgi:hypothetical protein